jgi:hypothetical protein
MAGITLTEALRQHAKEKCGVAADATDDIIQKALADKLAAGELGPADFARLSEITSSANVSPITVVTTANHGLSVNDRITITESPG